MSKPHHDSRLHAWYRRQSRIGRLSFVLTCIILAMLVLGRLSHAMEILFAIPVIILCAIVLSPLLIILLYRWATTRMLWKVRNRLLLTYLLMGVAPVVLFATLAAIAAYLFAGQFATSTALTLLDQATTEVRNDTASITLFALPNGEHQNVSHSSVTPHAAHSTTASAPARAAVGPPTFSLAVLKNGSFQSLLQPASNDPTAANPVLGQPMPSWLSNGFRGIILFNGQLYLCSMLTLPVDGHTLPVLGSMPLNKSTLDTTAKGLGSVTLTPGFSLAAGGKSFGTTDDKPASSASSTSSDSDDENANDDNISLSHISGGTLPPRAHLIDPPVLFTAPLTALAWQTGGNVHILVTVISRPSVLYTTLFANSTGTGMVVRIALISIASFFALLELFALLMAFGLSRTITRSVAELYQGTREIDRGNLAHRIRIKRKDQLGALATSFNSMAASLVDLLAQQREKERLLSELAIAQEVQTNLFPKSPVAFPGFEMHAVCIPARSVSGDYYDFIFGRSRELCLAFGDISGKGISAALLMASLHSAVRAFGISTGRDGDNSSSLDGQPSPALLLELLNRHIYSSTPPEKYATLFLAYYDGRTRRLTYSNGGHLPPVVLCADGTTKHLDCGGPVIGLLNDLKYEEATIELQPGDLLMAFTDGLTEPEQNSEEFGEQRLLDSVRQNAHLPLPILANNTLQILQRWIGSNEQPDDMTVLFARQL